MATDPPPQAPWIQLDLGSVQSFDRIMVVPAITGVANDELQPYAFPKRFRIDVSSSDDFNTFQLLYDSANHDLDSRSPFPVVIDAPKARTRYVRVTVTELSSVTALWTYALSEVMVLSGDRNIALDASVTMVGSTTLPPVWDASFLVDGRTPLGPPIMLANSNAELPQFDGVFCQSENSELEIWFQIDLESTQTIDAVRLFPVHARQGADYPGYAFPNQFRVEGSIKESFDHPVVLYRSPADFANPGNNPVTLKLPESSVRYLRIVNERGSVGGSNKFGFAEVQVLREDENLALGKPVTALHPWSERPTGLLVNGEASYGKIVPLSKWSDRWKSVRAIRRDIRLAEQSIDKFTRVAKQRAFWAVICMLSLVGVGLTVFVWNGRRQQIRQRVEFRMRLAQDLHDEIGSNLAAIARIGEVGEAVVDNEESREDWRSVRELASECTESMQETLWLLGGPKRGGEYLADQLQSITARMLPGVEVRWDLVPEFSQFRASDTTEREIILVFKAILANVARSSNATDVEILVTELKNRWHIRIEDNGEGFDSDVWESQMKTRGMGLESMKTRIKKLGGALQVQSELGEGTRVTMGIPKKPFS